LKDCLHKTMHTPVESYISLSGSISIEDIKHFFNDASVQVAIYAAKKLEFMNTVPYLELEEIDEFKWADIYKRMVY